MTNRESLMSTERVLQDPVIPWRLRGDLQIQAGGADCVTTWTIKDPLRLSYFHAEAEEVAFLKRLDGRTALSTIMETLRKQFPLSEFSESNLRQFLASAINCGLVRACVPGHSNRLTDIRNRQASQAMLRRALSLLTFRFRGLDPNRLLGILDRLFGWLFQIHFLVVGVVFCGSAGLVVFARRVQLQHELPDLGSLLTTTNVALLVLSLLFVKILHELGHGLTCRHYGGECHELGLLLIGFMPLLYCDVSDSWLQQDRRKRMLVAAAGIGTELFVASAAAFLWAYSRPGFLHTFFQNVMIVSSLNTVLINGNPLLKYDGYYVLSDWIRVPNLSAESRSAAVSFLDRVVLGLPSDSLTRRKLAHQCGMIIYGAASHVYRMTMLITLLWIMNKSLKLWRLESVAATLIVSVVAGILITAVRAIRERTRMVLARGDERRRVVIGLLSAGLLVVALLTIPLPYSVKAPFTFTPGVSTPVFVLEDGRIQPKVAIGQEVRQGDVIAVLVNDDLESEIVKVRGELQLSEVRSRNLATQRSSNPEAANALPSAEKAIQSRSAKVNVLLKKELNLTVVSPVDGSILPARNRPRPPVQHREGTSWFGQALSPTNRSEWMLRQTLLCWVGQPDDLRATCLLPEEDIELIEIGAEVILTFSSLPSVPLNGVVTLKKNLPETSVDRELVVNRMVAVNSFETNRPTQTLVAVSVALNPDQMISLPPLYSTGYASIRCKSVSLLRRSWRFVCHTFSFDR